MRRFLPMLSMVLMAPVAGAQRPAAGPAAMARADSAYRSGDFRRARDLYAQILAADSTASRAVFRLAQLHDSPEHALSLYRRYIALEPDDPWGHMAEGDLLARLGRWEEGLVAYAGAAAVAPGERDVALGRARLLERAGRPQDAADELSAWTTAHAGDGEAWDLLGRAWRQAGRPHAASQAFERAARLNVPGAAQRLRSARAASAPIVSPEANATGDSDGSRTAAFGGSVDVMPADGLRVGGVMHSLRIGAEVNAVQGIEGGARVDATIAPGLRLQAEAGAVHYGASPGSAAWSSARVMARVRTRPPANAPSIDLRLDREPLGFNVLLIANQAVRSEARAVIELPVAGLRARGSARLGRIETSTEAPNRRTTLEAALLLPSGRLQPGVQYRIAGFERGSSAGYFAPRRAESVEAGAYWETDGEGWLSFAADVGAGLQRVESHRRPGPPAGPPGQPVPGTSWSPLGRAWAQATIAIAPSRVWYTELEAYDAPFALEGAGSSGSWRFLSLTTGIRWAVR